MNTVLKQNIRKDGKPFIFKFGEKTLRVFIRDEADQSVFNEIFRLGEYRAAEEAVRGATDPIIDVGAHAGFFTLYCESLNPKAKIFAVEPEPENFLALKKHLKENKITNVKAIQAALAGQSGQRSLLISPDSHNHRLAEIGDNDGQKIEVIAYSFADFIKNNKIEKISLLKMDIEGGEFEIVKSLSARDLSVVKFLILEYHSKERYRELEQKLRENGFGAQVFPSKFDKTMGFIFAKNKR